VSFVVDGYALAEDRFYDPDSNLWIFERGEGNVRIGLDPLGAEIMGDIVAVSFASIGLCLERGDAFATLEAAKFVGPLMAPLRGTLVGANEDAVSSPGGINEDPLGIWLVELCDVDPDDFARLLRGEEAVAPWFSGAVEKFRREGAIAE
jgi:glycine cleavage system H lipoate-binding protein